MVKMGWRIWYYRKYKDLYSYGIDVITTGNHVWDQKGITEYIDKDPNLLKPYNFAEGLV